MKKILLALSAVLLLASCKPNGAYTLSGTISTAEDGDTITISIPQGRQLEPLATTVVTNGTYTFKGVTDTIQYAYLCVGGRPVVDFFLEPGTITLPIAEPQEASAIGTKNNNRMEAFNTVLKDIFDEYEKLSQQMNDEALSVDDRDAIRAQMAGMEDRFNEAIKSGIAENADCEYGIQLLQQYSYGMEAEELASILDKYVANFPDNETVKKLKEQNDKVLSVSAGKPFVDFEMADVDGNMHKLSEYVAQNKVTLVDFWASWCGPCRAEMPNVKADYETYKDKGFGIVGVSLDRDAESWKAGIEQLGITWPQISDLKYWECEGAALYGVRAIPATVLIGADGVIIARDLRGEDLTQKLAELLGE